MGDDLETTRYGQQLRALLLMRAAQLHVPIRPLHPYRELLAEVVAREQAILSRQEVPVACFGLAWDAVTEEVCAQCAVRTACLLKFAGTSLARRWGSTKTIAALAAKIEVSELAVASAVTLLRDCLWQEGLPSDRDSVGVQRAFLELPKLAPPLPPQPLPTPAPSVWAPATGRTVRSADAVAAAVGKFQRPKRRHRQGAKMPKPQAEVMAEEIKVLREKLARAKRRKKAERQLMRPVRTKEGRVADPWGAHTYLTRWLRERESTPLLAELRPGMELSRVYRKMPVKVTVQAGWYDYHGERFPTLYAAVAAATARAAKLNLDGRGKPIRRNAWSAPKFFGVQILRAIEATKCSST